MLACLFEFKRSNEVSVYSSISALFSLAVGGCRVLCTAVVRHDIRQRNTIWHMQKCIKIYDESIPLSAVYAAPHRARLDCGHNQPLSHSRLDATLLLVSTHWPMHQCTRHGPRPWQQFSTEENAYSVAQQHHVAPLKTSPVRPSAQLLLMVAQATTGHS